MGKLGVLLVIVPVNTMNTLKSDELITWFNMAHSDHVIARELLMNDKSKKKEAIESGVGDVETDQYTYLKGTPPENKNEVGISHVVADRIGAGIGDKVRINIGSETREYTVTAIYQTVNNMGEGIRFYQEEKLDYSYASGSFGTQIRYTDHPGQKTLKARKEILGKLYPKENIYTDGEYVSHMIGDIEGQLKGMKQMILAVVIGINILVIVLNVKLTL